jgi:DDE_Tnp_1-associated
MVDTHLLAYLAAVPDPRAARGRRHPLVAILTMAAAAVLASAHSMAAIGFPYAAQVIQVTRKTRRPRTRRWRTVTVTRSLPSIGGQAPCHPRSRRSFGTISDVV